MAIVMAGTATVQASEVTGILSSDATSNTQTSGNISGTVLSDSGGSSGGSSSRGRGGSSSNSPSGQVLGAADSTATPSFPNAGYAPEEVVTHETIWSTLVIFFKSVISI